jgi:hypothetical protein
MDERVGDIPEPMSSELYWFVVYPLGTLGAIGVVVLLVEFVRCLYG